MTFHCLHHELVREQAMSKKINQNFKNLFFPIFLEIISVTQNPIKASKKRSSVWPMRSQMAIFNGPIWAFIAINCPFSLLFSLSFLPPFFLFSFFLPFAIIQIVKRSYECPTDCARSNLCVFA